MARRRLVVCFIAVERRKMRNKVFMTRNLCFSTCTKPNLLTLNLSNFQLRPGQLARCQDVSCAVGGHAIELNRSRSPPCLVLLTLARNTLRGFRGGNTKSSQDSGELDFRWTIEAADESSVTRRIADVWLCTLRQMK
jgi:hypothetical protein